MIETQQAVIVHAPIAAIWDYVRDLQRWAEIMPGFREFEVIDDDNSVWTLKVGVGGLVRTVKVKVHVEEWAGPERVTFTFALQGDPVTGGGTYFATKVAPNQTGISLQVQVSGTGPMAPMWEAMGGPLLPKFALAFAEQLKAAIEAELGADTPAAALATAPAADPAPGGWSLLVWLKRLWARLLGGAPAREG